MTTTQKQLPALKWVTGYTGLDSCWIDDYEIDQGRLIVRLSENFSEVDDFEVEFLVSHKENCLVFELPCIISGDGKMDYENLNHLCGSTDILEPLFLSEFEGDEYIPLD